MGAQTGSPETPRRLTASVQVNRGLTTTVTMKGTGRRCFQSALYALGFHSILFLLEMPETDIETAQFFENCGTGGRGFESRRSDH
jgi:hypothetical protein